jgi:hypothetical protein
LNVVGDVILIACDPGSITNAPLVDSVAAAPAACVIALFPDVASVIPPLAVSVTPALSVIVPDPAVAFVVVKLIEPAPRFVVFGIAMVPPAVIVNDDGAPATVPSDSADAPCVT